MAYDKQWQAGIVHFFFFCLQDEIFDGKKKKTFERLIHLLYSHIYTGLPFIII